MRKYLLGLLAALLLAALGLTAVAAPASAHHVTVTGVVKCNTTTGDFDITWTIANSEVDKTMSYTSRLGNGTVAPGGTTVKTESVDDEGEVSLSVDASWPNHVTSHDTGKVWASGTCEEPKVDLCHATGSAQNPFVKISVSVSGAYHGHLGQSHQGGEDIIPPFTYQGQSYSQNWNAAGQAIYNNGCVKAPHDECPNVPGNQPPGTDCNPPDCDKTCPVKTKGHGKNITCDGVRSGTYNNVRINRGDTCILLDSYVNGDVTGKGGRSAYLLDTTVVGDVSLHGFTGDIRIGNKSRCRYDPRIGGNLSIIDSHNVLVCQTTVCKAMRIKHNDGKIAVRDSATRRLIVRGNTRFDSDGPSNHAREHVIRLFNIKADHVSIGANAPRPVKRHNVG